MTQPERVRVRIVIEIDAPASMERRPSPTPDPGPSPHPRQDRPDPGTEGVPVRCLVVDGPAVGDGLTVYLEDNAPTKGQKVQIFYDGKPPKDGNNKDAPHFEPVSRWSSQTWNVVRKGTGKVSAQGFSNAGVPIGAATSQECAG